MTGRHGRAYVDQRIDDIETAAAVADLAAARWQLSRPVLLRHGMNAIFRCRDVILRVATPNARAEHSIELARMLAGADVPVVAPARDDVTVAEGMSVTAWEYVEPTGDPVDWSAVGDALRTVHAVSPDQLPDGLPRPSPEAFPWWDFEALLADVERGIDVAALSGLRSSIDRWTGWASFADVVLCHGDVHPGNVIMSQRGPLLIDWDLLCIAPRGWDHAPMMTWSERWGGEVGAYDELVEGYGWSGRGDSASEAFAELRLVAATLMRVKAGLADPSARPEADRRLAYWRGDTDAPTWRAQ